jgi:hypothetical protein
MALLTGDDLAFTTDLAEPSVKEEQPTEHFVKEEPRKAEPAQEQPQRLEMQTKSRKMAGDALKVPPPSYYAIMNTHIFSPFGLLYCLLCIPRVCPVGC